MKLSIKKAMRKAHETNQNTPCSKRNQDNISIRPGQSVIFCQLLRVRRASLAVCFTHTILNKPSFHSVDEAVILGAGARLLYG